MYPIWCSGSTNHSQSWSPEPVLAQPLTVGRSMRWRSRSKVISETLSSSSVRSTVRATAVLAGPVMTSTAWSRPRPMAEMPLIFLMTSPERTPARWAGVPSRGATTVMFWSSSSWIWMPTPMNSPSVERRKRASSSGQMTAE